jgi:hypothetical protein
MISRKKFFVRLTCVIYAVLVLFGNSALAQSGLSIPSSGEYGLYSPSGGIKDILTNVLSWLLSIIGIIALISFVISGFQYFLAAGDEKSMDTAKRNMLYSVIGIVVALSGYIVVKAVDTMMKGTSSVF